MQLLVSVRSADEVESALAGGADIIDAKEPANGSLGAVSPATLSTVAFRVSTFQELSIALGDVRSIAEVISSIDGVELPSRSAPTYLKLGFAGVASPDTAGKLLATAVERASRHPMPVTIVAVAYADAERAAALPPEVILGSAVAAGAGGVLIDTHLKDGTRLLDWMTPDSLAAWVSLAHASGLLAGVAGALGQEDVGAVAVVEPDVIGFRGAACDAGRLGRVSAERVSLLRRCVDAANRSSNGISAYIADGWRNA